MIRIECVVVNVIEFLQAVKVHVDGPQPFEGEKEPHTRRPIYTVAYIKAANGVHELARVNSSFFRVLWPVLHQAKIATMHDRALLRVVKARRAIKFNYNIWHMAELGVQTGRHENNNERYWFHPKYNPHGESRTGDLPWSLALPPKHLGCRNMFEAYLTIEDKYIVSSLCDAWKVAICNPHDTCSLLRGSPIECKCKFGLVCQICSELADLQIDR